MSIIWFPLLESIAYLSASRVVGIRKLARVMENAKRLQIQEKLTAQKNTLFEKIWCENGDTTYAWRIS